MLFICGWIKIRSRGCRLAAALYTYADLWLRCKRLKMADVTPTEVVERHTHLQDPSIQPTAAVSLDKGKHLMEAGRALQKPRWHFPRFRAQRPVFSSGYDSAPALMMSRTAACFCRWNIQAGPRPTGSQSHPLQLWIGSQTSANSPTLKEKFRLFSAHYPVALQGLGLFECVI